MTYQILSPDGFPISLDNFRSMKAARAYLTEWVKRYERQGYYRDARWNQIAIEDLPEYCELITL